MKKVLIIVALMLIVSCTKKAPTIAWEKETTFSEILSSAGDKYVMIDFIKDG